MIRAALTKRLLSDARDWALFSFYLRAWLLLPLGIVVFAVSAPWAKLFASIVFFAYYWTNLEPFVTMFHDVNHRPLFGRNFAWLNKVTQWLFGVDERAGCAGIDLDVRALREHRQYSVDRCVLP